MKFFAYILSLYVVILTIMPCIDVHQDTISQNIELTNNTSDTHQNDTDHCSPFCSCTCCASPVVFQNYTLQIACYPIVKEHFSEYNSSFNSTVHYSIWQPPKIS